MKYALLLSVFPFIVADTSGQQAGKEKPVAQALVAPLKPGPQVKLHTQASGDTKPAMQRAWYEYGTSQTLPPTPAAKNEFAVVATTAKAMNFVSSYEEWIRQHSVATADTNYLYTVSPWKQLTSSQKRLRRAQQQAAYRRQADSLHTVDNQGRYWVWLLNNSAAPVILPTQDGSVFCVLQALDKNQQWRPVQYWRYSGCGNSYGARYLRPKENLSLLAAIPRRGDFKTKLRYKLAGVRQFYYSNAFEGRISYSEFAEPPGIYGRSATGQRVSAFKLDSLPRPHFGKGQAFPFHQGGKWGESLPY